MFKNKKIEPVMYAIFRILIGFMFFFHGGQKVFGWFAKGAQPTFSMLGIVGILELIVGLLLFLGLWSRLSAFIGAIVMIGAFFGVHFISFLFGGFTVNNPIPIANGGEMAVLYLVSFLLILAKGNGVCSLEKTLFKRECF